MSRDDKISILVVPVATFHLFLYIDVTSQVRICGWLLQVCSPKMNNHMYDLYLSNMEQKLMPDIVKQQTQIVAHF